MGVSVCLCIEGTVRVFRSASALRELGEQGTILVDPGEGASLCHWTWPEAIACLIMSSITEQPESCKAWLKMLCMAFR